MTTSISPFFINLLKQLGNPAPTTAQVELAIQAFNTLHLSRVFEPPPNLTQTQGILLNLIAKGHDMNQITRLMNITISTAKTHKKNILRKLNCVNISQAVFKAFCYGCLPLSEDSLVKLNYPPKS